MKIQIHELQKDIARLKKTQYKTERQAELAKMEVASKKETLRDIQLKHEVSLSYFLRFSETTKDMFDEVLRRIFMALGVDTTSKDARINFETFVRIKCFL